MTGISPTMSTSGYDAAFASQTDDVWLAFLTIDHPSIVDGPLRFVQNSVKIQKGGFEYTPIMFTLNLPGQHDKRASQAQLSIPNVDRRITDSLRNLMGTSENITVTIEVSLASAPDDIQHGPWYTSLRHISWNELSVDAELIPLVDLDQEWPVDRMDAVRYPGLFP